jgi:hypothetical protein
MGSKYQFGPGAPRFPVQSFQAKDPRRPFNSRTARTRGPGYFSRRNRNNAAGNLQLFAEGFHCPGVTPAFFSGPYAMFHVCAVKDKPGIRAKLHKACQHGTGLSYA